MQPNRDEPTKIGPIFSKKRLNSNCYQQKFFYYSNVLEKNQCGIFDTQSYFKRRQTFCEPRMLSLDTK